MKPYQIYYFRNDPQPQRPIILYEFDTNNGAIQFCNECDRKHTRQTAFESDGKYYVGEYITKDTMRFITSHFKIAVTRISNFLNVSVVVRVVMFLNS